MIDPTTPTASDLAAWGDETPAQAALRAEREQQAVAAAFDDGYDDPVPAFGGGWLLSPEYEAARAAGSVPTGENVDAAIITAQREQRAAELEQERIAAERLAAREDVEFTNARLRGWKVRTVSEVLADASRKLDSEDERRAKREAAQLHRELAAREEGRDLAAEARAAQAARDKAEREWVLDGALKWAREQAAKRRPNPSAAQLAREYAEKRGRLAATPPKWMAGGRR